MTWLRWRVSRSMPTGSQRITVGQDLQGRCRCNDPPTQFGMATSCSPTRTHRQDFGQSSFESPTPHKHWSIPAGLFFSSQGQERPSWSDYKLVATKWLLFPNKIRWCETLTAFRGQSLTPAFNFGRKNMKKSIQIKKKNKFLSCVCILNFIQLDLKGSGSKVAFSFLHQKTRKLLICQFELKKWNSSWLKEEISFFSPWHIFLNVASKMLKEIFTCDSVFGDQTEELVANDQRSLQSFFK